MAVLLLFQNHCGTGVQRAENPDGNEWQALWWTHKLIQSRKAKVLSLFLSSHWWTSPSCNFGCCFAVVGLCSGAVWCWVSREWGCAMGEPSPGTGQEGPSSPPAWAGDVHPPGWEMGLSCGWLCCPRCLKGMQLENSSQLSRTSAYSTQQHCWSQGGRAQVTPGQLRPLPSLPVVAVFFPHKDSQSFNLCACD